MVKKKAIEVELIDFLFSWRIKDVFNENLLKEEVKKIPTTFSSMEDYFGSYKYPLIEETRADLCSSLGLLSHAPLCKILHLEASPKELEYDICMEPQTSSCKESYKPKSGDILALANVRPQSVSDLDGGGRFFNLAYVLKNEDDESGPPFDIKIRVSKQIEGPIGRMKSLFAVSLINITTNKRIWKALQTESSKDRNLDIVRNLLYTDSSVRGTCDLCSSAQLENVLGGRLVHHLQSSKLNEAQISAVLGSILTSQCTHKNSIKLIWGPPGTGKTKTVSALLWTLLAMECRTLTCAPTNVAVLEVASRLLKLIMEPFPHELVPLGNVVLFGNKDRMDLEGDDLEQVFLDFRVDRLSECFAPHSGWNHQLATMVALLEDGVAQHQLYLELEKEMENRKDGETKKEKIMNCQEFFIKRFSNIADKLGDCLRMLITHLPTASLPNNMSLLMMKAHTFLDRFGKLLHKKKLSDEEMDELFKGEEVSNSKKSELCKTRIILLRFLKSLKRSLKLPNFLDKYLIQEFCLKGAFLIFCTVSSSIKLYSDEMTPLDLLVIDEAAQLKECESLIPLQLPGIRHAVLIGDECQLPAMIKSKVSEKAHFGRSLFERLVSLGHMKHLLDLQYRMHPKISHFPNSKFYSNRILNAENVKLKSYERQYLPGRMYGPYSFINVDNGKETFEDGHSPKNMVEVAVVLQLVKNLFEASVASRQRLSVGIISPYKAQVVAIQEKLGKNYEMESYFTVNVKSIDGFQGGEEDVIIISTVRSNSDGFVGFLANPQRMNVALTRARHCLWVLGNGSTLSKSRSLWTKLVVDARKRGCYFDADLDKSLVDAIIHLNNEQGQLDCLLHTESLLFCKARWKVLFSDDFKKSLKRIKIAQIRKEVITLLMKLANGWRPKGENHNFANGSSFKLLKQSNVGGQYLLWTIDIMKDSNYKQVMKFWNILPSAEVPKLIRRLDTIFTKYSKDYISKCEFISTEKELAVPMSWKKIPNVLLPDDQCKTESGEELLSHLASLNLDKKPILPSSSSRDHSSSSENLRDFDTEDDLSSQLASLSLHKNHTSVSKKIWKTSKLKKSNEKNPNLSSNEHLIDEGSHSKKKSIDEENPCSTKSKKSQAKGSSHFTNNAKQAYQAKTKSTLAIKG